MRPPAHLVSVALAALCVLSADSALAADPVDTSALTRRVQDVFSRWSDAQGRVASTRSAQASLELRVVELKRLHAEKRLANTNELETLLRRSLDADRTLSTDTDRAAAIADDVRRLVRAGVSSIDAEIKALVPSVKAGERASREAAARRINDLRQARKRLRELVARLKNDSSEREWASYEVAIEPLDGPSELDEKADFVEDTRDKVQAKRDAIRRLVRELRQEREVALAAKDFNTDVSLFDEDLHTGVVRRTTPSGGLASAENDGTRTTGGATPPAAPQAGSDLGFNGQPGEAAPPPRDNTAGGLDPSVGKDDSVAPPAAPAPQVLAPLPGVTKNISPGVLINLSVDDLGTRGLDLGQLERLMTDLERLDRYLATQASRIRARAAEIEADETKRRTP